MEFLPFRCLTPGRFVGFALLRSLFGPRAESPGGVRGLGGLVVVLYRLGFRITVFLYYASLPWLQESRE